MADFPKCIKSFRVCVGNDSWRDACTSAKLCTFTALHSRLFLVTYFECRSPSTRWSSGG